MSETLHTSTHAGRSWEELARGAAQAGSEGSAETEELRQILVFLVDGASYAVPVESVREIVRIRPITPIPRVTRPVRGVISLRGEIIQVVDLRLRLGLPRTEPSKATRIIVVHGDEERVAGILVDAVREVLRVAEESIGAPAGGDAGGFVGALCARGEEFISLVDLDRVLDIHDDG